MRLKAVVLRDLADAVKRYTDTHDRQSPLKTAIDGVTILRSDHKTRSNRLIFKPALCITVPIRSSSGF